MVYVSLYDGGCFCLKSFKMKMVMMDFLIEGSSGNGFYFIVIIIFNDLILFEIVQMQNMVYNFD